ncbi:VPA1269 family protein [Colwellia psychrerythraea]|uniref:Putative site-specific recombinase, phage integrase family n=1 Tax=Colwellia psychrerythraea (strain 34H / ATCC BAA-681) TaxID=167879 RepID=Q48AG0_COLP3|nr:VPA1269 family protein [Colwellia psychrerythraea]AAZ25294.1 putative site-specific recombinase, phage integrase family [Colwellia psychrerythraea 34H]
MSNHRDKFYITWEEASKATIVLDCAYKKDYLEKYKSDPKLPSNPQRSYPEFKEKGGWSAYLSTGDKFYRTWAEASKAAIALGFNRSGHYFNGYKKDPKLHSDPSVHYPDFYKKGGWAGFLGNPVPTPKHETWEEASAAAIKLGITNTHEYKALYKKDPLLPSDPQRSYQDVWDKNGGWSGFFGRQLGSIDTSKMLKVLEIIDIEGYAEIDHVKLPKDPLKTYDLETFEELLTLKVYDLAQVKAYCERKGFQEVAEYRKASSDQQHLNNATPIGIKGYVSGKSIISKLTNFERATKEHPDYSQWFDMAIKFALLGKNIRKKKVILFNFVMEYLVDLEQPTQPAAFFARKHAPPLLTSFMEKQPKFAQSITGINILKDFIEDTFHRCCQDEDDDGISVVLPGFINKWSRIISTVEPVKIDRPDKSEKWPLAMNYIDRAAKFLVPDSAKTFQDVMQLECDWFIVDESIIDKDDLNCVWRTKMINSGYGKKMRYQMWSPVRTLALFVLFSMPLRGQQICWLDSGEADTEIPIINAQDEVVWVKNDHHLINDVNKRTERQGFLRRFKDAKKTTVTNDKGIEETRREDIIGSYITTNKTSKDGKGYEVAYMPIHLIKWMIRLREWQSKYNPIDKLTSWESVALINEKNNKILKAMKSQAFLFRDPDTLHAEDKCQPIGRDKAMSNTFSWVLYQIQDKDIPLAYLPEGKSDCQMNNYKSDFTPHGMRVSFISAYILDAKLPISIVAALVGHASIVMTIYYTVTTNQDYYEMLSAGHQAALTAAPARIAGLIKNKQLKLSSSDFFDSNGQPVKPMYDKAPYAALGFKDFGICPVACSKCHEGGDEVKPGLNVFGPVRSGYLGPSNCFVCRFFITGPGYIGGLKTMLAEVGLEAKESGKRMEKFREEREELEYLQYRSRKDDLPFEHEAKLNNILTLHQQEQEKFDALSYDASTIAIMGYRCSKLLQNQSENAENKGHQLILQEGNPMLGVKIDEVSEFAHMTEICQNAEIYACANPSRALPKRTKMLDMFALNNGFSPKIFLLSDEDQLKVGNQITSIMLNRLNGSWDDAERLMDGTVTLKDLGLSGKEIMEPVTLALNHWTPEAQVRIEVINV